MTAPKDYDTTLARIAGNIASGLMESGDVTRPRPETFEAIAEVSVRVAAEIVARCRATAVVEPKP
jgi:hypothetical protein